MYVWSFILRKSRNNLVNKKVNSSGNYCVSLYSKRGYKLERRKSQYHYFQRYVRIHKWPQIFHQRVLTTDLKKKKKTFSKVAGDKIKSNKTLAFLYLKEDKWAENKIRETIPFIKGTNSVKYLGVNLIKQVKDLYDKAQQCEWTSTTRAPRVHKVGRKSPAAHEAEDGLVGNQWEERPLALWRLDALG